MRYLDKEAPTVEEALKAAIEEAGITMEEAWFEVLNDGLSGKPAKVRLYLDIEELKRLEDILQEILVRMGSELLEMEVRSRGGQYYVNITTRGMDAALIGSRGRTLEALQYLVRLMLRKQGVELPITLDIAGYLERRRKFIANKAIAVARRVLETGQEMRIDQLGPRELRIAERAIRKVKGVRAQRVHRGDEEILLVVPES